MDASPMIELDAVSHRFNDLPVLDQISLDLAERRIGIVGANGSGKSTLARLLNGLIVPEQGRVRVDGLDTRGDAKAVRRKVGFVFQNPDNQIVMPTVEEDIAFGLKNLKLDPAAIAGKVNAVLARYNLERYRTQSSYLLSAGEKQLLAISSVLVMEPAYVVFDEPTTLLDHRNKRRVAEVIGALPQSVIMVSHDLDLLANFDRVVVIEQGRIAMDAEPATALDFYLRSLG
jgi:biotin transport system ATP-binding protein